MDRLLVQIAVQSELGAIIPLAMSWNRELVRQTGRAILAELRAKPRLREASLAALQQKLTDDLAETLRLAGVEV